MLSRVQEWCRCNGVPTICMPCHLDRWQPGLWWLIGSPKGLAREGCRMHIVMSESCLSFSRSLQLRQQE